MIASLLKDAGLDSEAVAVYGALLEHGAQTAGELLAQLKSINRSTLYKELRGLKDRGLVSEGKRNGKILFSPLSPEALLSAAEEQKKMAEENFAKTSKALETLRTKYLASFQKPTIRYYEGTEELKEMYDGLIGKKKETYLIRTAKAQAYRQLFGKWWGHYLNRRKRAGIVTHALTPDYARAPHDPKADAARNVIRTWLRPEDYAAPIDIQVYGDVLSIVSYGKEIFGLTVENADIAQAFTDLFKLAELGAKTVKVAHDHE